MNLKPLGDRLIVKQAEAEAQTKSGIILAETAKEKPQKATVLAVGEGRFNDAGERVPMGIEVGDVVLYSKYGGTEIKHEDETYLILSANDVLAIIEG
ncbi:MAG: co-chaperone GroES [Coriobacteriia bacterium]|nr:co-chaperone GroES [Coriobacteriia bacterium]